MRRFLVAVILASLLALLMAAPAFALGYEGQGEDAGGPGTEEYTDPEGNTITLPDTNEVPDEIPPASPSIP